MKKLLVTLGQDLSAYATIEVPADTDLSDDNLAAIARKAVENTVFEADWSTVNALRVVVVNDDEGKFVHSEVPVELCCYEGGAALEAFLRGHVGFDALINAAVQARLIEPSTQAAFSGHLTTPAGESMQVNFYARAAATQTELDLAFFHALCQQADIACVTAGEVSADTHSVAGSE